MANFITLTGFVANEPQTKGTTGKFSVHFYDTKREGNPVYSYMTVKVFDFSSLPKKGDIVNVIGTFHKYTWNEKEYCEIWCNYDGWSKVERRTKESSEAVDEPVGSTSEDIPF